MLLFVTLDVHPLAVVLVLLRQVTHPKSYHSDAPIYKSTLEQKQLEDKPQTKIRCRISCS